MNYLEKLKLLMKQHGLNENQLAKKANVPQSTINSLFQKNNLPTISTLEALLEALDMTLSEFFYDDALMKKHQLEEQNLMSKWNFMTSEQKNGVLILIDLLLNTRSNRANGSKCITKDHSCPYTPAVIFLSSTYTRQTL